MSHTTSGTLDPATVVRLLDDGVAGQRALCHAGLVELPGSRAQWRPTQNEGFAERALPLITALFGGAPPNAPLMQRNQMLGLLDQGHLIVCQHGLLALMSPPLTVGLLDLRKLMSAIDEAVKAGKTDEAMMLSPRLRELWVSDGEFSVIVESALAPGVQPWAVDAGARYLPPLRALQGKSGGMEFDGSWIQGAWIDEGDRLREFVRVPFTQGLVAAVDLDASELEEAPMQLSRNLANDVLREVISGRLGEGLETQIEPFPQGDGEFRALLAELRRLPDDDLDNRLIIGGFADHPIGEGEDRMRCMECIYFLPHRRWCDLPELPVPVEADWFCRLWKM